MIHTGDCIEVMRGMEADSVDAVVTDPPYGLEFMGKEWDAFRPKTANRGGKAPGRSKIDPTKLAPVQYGIGGRRSTMVCDGCGKRDKFTNPHSCPDDTGWSRIFLDDDPRHASYGRAFQAWCQQWGTEALRVTKPGGYLLAFGGTRTHHRLVCGLEDAGWVIRDELTWIYACLSDDTEVLTDLGWVLYNRASEATHAAAFDTATGKLRWERIEAVHQYEHEGPMAAVGPSLTTLNHRIVLSSESEVPLPCHADLRRLWGQLRDVGSVPGDTRQDVLQDVPIGAAVGVSQGQDEASERTQGPDVHLPHLRNRVLSVARMDQAEQRAVLLKQVQRSSAAPSTYLPNRDATGLEAGDLAASAGEDDRPEQPSLEGRRYRVQEAWELFGSPVRESAGVGEADGSQGRLHHGAPPTDGRALRVLDDADGVRESREPRPDRQSSWEPDALAGQSVAQVVRMEQMHPRYGLPADAPRLVDYAGVVWCITVPSGAFVARRNGVAFVTGNSGFPKGRANLKPAHEPIVLARKPGPLRPLGIDECRIPGAEDGSRNRPPSRLGSETTYAQDEWTRTAIVERNDTTGLGRWPSNLLLSDPALFDEPNPYVVGSGATATSGWRNEDRPEDAYGIAESFGAADVTGPHYGDTGGYSRFFLVPKSSRADREPVVRGQVEHKPAGALNMRTDSHSVRNGMNTAARENAHPTVKPTDLMRHLVRLVTPSGGTVLDPFLGSGTTAIAAELEGFPWIAIEKEPEYVAIAEARLNGTQRGLGLDVPAPTRRDIGKQRGNKDADGNPTLAGLSSPTSWFHSVAEEPACWCGHDYGEHEADDGLLGEDGQCFHGGCECEIFGAVQA